MGLSQLPRRESTPPLLPSQLKFFQSQLLPPMLLDSHSTMPTTTELIHTTTDMLDTHTTTDTPDTHTTTDMLATHTCIPFQQLPQPRLTSNKAHHWTPEKKKMAANSSLGISRAFKILFDSIQKRVIFFFFEIGDL